MSPLLKLRTQRLNRTEYILYKCPNNVVMEIVETVLVMD